MVRIRSKGYVVLLLLAVFFFLSGLFFNPISEIVQGSTIILTSPANLLTDYFYIASIGSAFWNAGFMVLKSIVILWLLKVPVNGGHLAAVFTVAGFSLFGKNLYNSVPIILGVYLFTLLMKVEFTKYVLPAMFGTALGPVVSEVSFNLGLVPWLGHFLGLSAGVFIGLILPSLAEHVKSFHKGLSLYNIGFAAGLIGMFMIAILRGFGIYIAPVTLVSSGNNTPLTFVLALLFVAFFLLGWGWNGFRFSGFLELLRDRNLENRDYVFSYGLPMTLMNMAIMGVTGLAYVRLVQGELNGPVLGGVFTMAGFGAYGKHVRNVLPVMLGVFLAGMFSLHEVSSVGIVLAALFGTTLAPIAQVYGPIAGVVAGMIHVFLVVNIGVLHAGMNLYNNGFSGGFVAALLVPLLDTLLQYKKGLEAKGYLYRRIR